MKLLLCAALAAQPVFSDQSVRAQEVPQADALAPFERMRSEDLLLLSLVLDGATLTEALGAYGDPADPMLPIGEISRLLGLDVAVQPGIGRVDGRIGDARAELTIDLAAGLIRLGGRDIAFGRDEIAISDSDIYASISLIERILPITATLDPESLLLQVSGTQPLPIERRAASDRRMDRLARGDAGEPILQIDNPYRIIAPPAFDLIAETGYDSRRDLAIRHYDLRTAGDVLGMDLTGYLGSDETGSPATARATLEKKSANGDLLGPIGATSFALGDVYTPIMTAGPLATEGRGFAFSTAPLGNASVFQRITLRGELPIGYQAELYVNEVLRAGQRVPTEGRYEFLDVPLSRGVNVIRVVLYGPNGERSEVVRVVNVGGGLVEKGQTTLDVGVVQQQRPIFRLARDRETGLVDKGDGKLRAIIRAAHGLRDDLTLLASGALYPDLDGKQHGVASAGVSGSLLGTSVRLEHFEDFGTGRADVLGLAGEIGSASLTVRHAEYGGAFVDENEVLASGDRPLLRTTSVDGSLAISVAPGLRIPLSAHAERAQFSDGGESWAALSRASAIVLDTLFSAGVDYTRDRFADGQTDSSLSGDFAASRSLGEWQLRGVIDYDLLPNLRVLQFLATADRALTERLGLHVGASRTFGIDRDIGVQAGAFLRLPFGEMALTGDYQLQSDDFRVGLRLGFGLVRDPLSKRLRLTPPGVASGGSAVVAAFVDTNGNEVLDEGEEPVPGVRLFGGDRTVTTDTDGRAFVTGLGNGVSTRLIADVDLIDAFYVTPPPQNIELAPRPGSIALVRYAFRPASEVTAQLSVIRDGKRIGLAAVNLRLLRDGAVPIEAMSQFDGSVVFDGASPGHYRIELDPEEATRLGMRLVGAPEVTVRDDGTAPAVEIEVTFGEGS